MGIFDVIKDVIPFAGPIGSIAGGVMDMMSQKSANQANAANVQKQMDFQNQQSSTSWQRGVKDMEAAGLNPALAYQQGGATAQSGAAATMQPITQNTPSKLATALDAYNQIATGVSQRALLSEQANAASADARLKQIQGTTMVPDAKLAESPDYLDSYAKTRFSELAAKGFTATKTPERFSAEMGNIGANTAQAQAAAANARSLTTLNEQNFQNEWFRKNISPYLNSTSKALNTLNLFQPLFK